MNSSGWNAVGDGPQLLDADVGRPPHVVREVRRAHRLCRDEVGHPGVVLVALRRGEVVAVQLVVVERALRVLGDVAVGALVGRLLVLADVHAHVDARSGRGEPGRGAGPGELGEVGVVVVPRALRDDQRLQPVGRADRRRRRAAPREVERVDERRRIERARPHRRPLEVEVLTVEREHLLRQGRLDDLDRLGEDVLGLVHVEPELAELAARRPATEADERRAARAARTAAA